VVLRSLRCGAARGHHARRRHRKGPQDRDRAVRRERGAAHVQALRPRAAGQAAGAGGARRRTPMTSALSGKALTVLGAVEGSALGITLPHEHLLIDFAVMFREPTGASEKTLAYQPVSLSNVGWVRQNFNANLDNLRLLDEQIARDEIMLFKHAGGHTVVDPTNVSLSRDPLALARIARATGLSIVMGAGYYVAAAHPADMDRRSEDS